MVDPFPPGVQGGQSRVVGALRAWSEAHGSVRWLTVGCSLARGNSDALSDADVALGVDEGAVGEVTTALASGVEEFGEVVASFASQIPEVAIVHRRLFVQFRDRVQLDAVIVEASQCDFPGALVLYDPDRMVVNERFPWQAPSGEDALGWGAAAWEALSNVEKYVRRQSDWEAHAQLERARTQYWRVLAYVRGVADPQFGLTSIFDEAQPDRIVPHEALSTVASVERNAIVNGAVALSELLAAAMSEMEPPPGGHARFGEYVAGLLSRL